MVMQKPSKIQGIKQRVMNFGVPTVLNHISLPAENEQNLPCGFQDREQPPKPPPLAKPGKMHDVMLIAALGGAVRGCY